MVTAYKTYNHTNTTEPMALTIAGDLRSKIVTIFMLQPEGLENLQLPYVT